jgi:MFS superfamily sulfate permease-like transporter
MLAVLLGMVLGGVFEGIPALALGAEHFVDLPDVGGLSDLPRPEWSAITDPRVWKIAAVIALVASLETLLCVEATDKMDPLKRSTPANRELHAQGLGNLVSGFLGGLPVTQVIVRSSANIQSGGRSKLSAILHGLFILVAVLAFPGLLREVPLASLAAVLFIVGYKLIKPSQFKDMWHQGFMRFLPFTLTAFGVAFIDLLTGVGLGMAVAVIHILWKNYRVPFHFDRDAHRRGEPIRIELSEDVTFLNKAGIKRTLEELPRGSRVVIDASRTVDLDPDVEEIIGEFRADAPARDIQVECTGFGAHRQQNTKVLFRQVILTAARSFASSKN